MANTHIHRIFGIDRACSPDISLGAYLISNLQPHCSNCGTTDTVQWRKGWFEGKIGSIAMLCNRCGLKYAKSQYCQYCMYVYYKEEERSHHKDAWLVCSNCQKWVHKNCEILAGQGHCTMDAINYACPQCRGFQINNGAITTPSAFPPSAFCFPQPGPVKQPNKQIDSSSAPKRVMLTNSYDKMDM